MKRTYTRGAFTALAALAALTLTAVLLQAQTPPDELSALSLSSGTLRPTFAAATTEYRAAVHYNVSQVTVTATAAVRCHGGIPGRYGRRARRRRHQCHRVSKWISRLARPRSRSRSPVATLTPRPTR